MLLAVAAATLASVVLWTAPDRATSGALVACILPWGLAVASLPRGTPGIPLVVGIGALVRLVLVGSPPLLSDDLYRFLFEGLALNAGHNPFLSPPSSLAHLDPWLAERVNHPDIPSIYPPVAQLWFRLSAALGARPVVVQAMTAGIDLVNIALIARICRSAGRPTWPALVWALHPLAVLESANGAHLEPLGVAMALSAVVLFQAEKPRWAGVPVTLGIGVKLLPVLFAPVLVRRLGPGRALLAGFLATLLLIVLALPVLSAGPALFEALSRYSASWSFNGFAFPLLQPVLGTATRGVLAVIGLGVAAHAALRRPDPLRLWLQVGAAFVLLSPTVHPWYVLWVLAPAVALGGRGWAVAAAFLQCSYAVLLFVQPDGSWAVPVWLGPVTWGPAICALVIALWWRPADAPRLV